MKKSKQNINPFSLTKSADMPDDLIDKLWVHVENFDIESKIKSLNPVFLVGGKGSGKTHLLRHYSYHLQKIRFQKRGLGKMTGVIQDRYIGIYYRCKGLQASRFSGKDYSAEYWLQLFEYAFELTLAQELLFVLNEIVEDESLGREISIEIGHILDLDVNNLSDLKKGLAQIRRKFDRAINNSAFFKNLDGNEDAKILTSRGDLIFGIPKIIKAHIPDFNIPIIYMLDEYENFEANHQEYINTLIREKEPEVSIKVGVRRYGIRSSKTLSAGEELIEGSEKETFVLDDNFRLDNHKNTYKEFLLKLVESRLKQLRSEVYLDHESHGIDRLLLEYKPNWSDPKITEKTNKKTGRPHIEHFRKYKLTGLPEGEAKTIINYLSFPEFPFLEKLNIFNFYRTCKECSPLEAAKTVHMDCNAFLESKGRDKSLKTSRAIAHYKNNLYSQLIWDYTGKTYYNGLDNIMTMSEGMPRNFLQILKRIYDWSYQLEENPFIDRETEGFSINIQRTAIRESADWFFEDVNDGENLHKLKDSMDRLGQLLRINHFADLPKECSCNSVAIDRDSLSEESRNIIDMAEDYSCLIAITEPHKNKNHTSDRIKKLRINRMLCPRWDLPLASRGTKQLNSEEAELIFNADASNHQDFLSLRNKWEVDTKFSLTVKQKQRKLL
jgi:hypothetical protein